MKFLVALLAVSALQACAAYSPLSRAARDVAATAETNVEIDAALQPEVELEEPIQKISGLSKAFGSLFKASNWLEDKVDSVKNAAKKLVSKVRGARDVAAEVAVDAETVAEPEAEAAVVVAAEPEVVDAVAEEAAAPAEVAATPAVVAAEPARPKGFAPIMNFGKGLFGFAQNMKEKATGFGKKMLSKVRGARDVAAEVVVDAEAVAEPEAEAAVVVAAEPEVVDAVAEEAAAPAEVAATPAVVAAEPARPKGFAPIMNFGKGLLGFAQNMKEKATGFGKKMLSKVRGARDVAAEVAVDAEAVAEPEAEAAVVVAAEPEVVDAVAEEAAAPAEVAATPAVVAAEPARPKGFAPIMNFGKGLFGFAQNMKEKATDFGKKILSKVRGPREVAAEVVVETEVAEPVAESESEPAVAEPVAAADEAVAAPAVVEAAPAVEPARPKGFAPIMNFGKGLLGFAQNMKEKAAGITKKTIGSLARFG